MRRKREEKEKPNKKKKKEKEVKLDIADRGPHRKAKMMHKIIKLIKKKYVNRTVEYNVPDDG